MNQIRIAVDSSAEFEPAELASLGIDCIPLIVNFGDETFLDGDMTDEAFYRRMEREKELPKTAAPGPDVFETYFRDAKESGDDVVMILLGSELSGTIQSARLGMEAAAFDRGFIVDSRSTLGVIQILALEALKLRDEGKRAEEIVAALEALREKIRLLAFVDTLENLKKGGRLSRGAAIVGSLLNIKPVVTIEGKVQVIGKGIGTRKAMKLIVEKIKEKPIDAHYPVVFGYTKCKEGMDHMMDALKDLVDIHSARTLSVGPVIGTHVGPNAAVIIYVKKS